MYYVMQAKSVWSRHRSIEAAHRALVRGVRKCNRLGVTPYYWHIAKLKGTWRRGDAPHGHYWIESLFSAHAATA